MRSQRPRAQGRNLIVKRVLVLVAIIVTAAVAALPAVPASAQGDTLVSVGSPPSPFAQNKQNEPTVAIDAHNPSVVVAGSNDEIDIEACNAGNPTRRGHHGRLLLVRRWTDVDTAHLHGMDGAGLTGPGTLHTARRADRHPPEVLREWTGLRRGPLSCLRPTTGPEWEVLLVERLTSLLRQPDLELQQPTV